MFNQSLSFNVVAMIVVVAIFLSFRAGYYWREIVAIRKEKRERRFRQRYLPSAQPRKFK